MPYNKNSVSPTEESKRVKISYSSRVKGVSESVSEPLFLFVPVLYFPWESGTLVRKVLQGKWASASVKLYRKQGVDTLRCDNHFLD